jgi:hypothetical protein
MRQTIYVPTDKCGEPGGEDVHPDVIAIMRAYARLGWWPIDFGEQLGEEVTELWLTNDPCVGGAIHQTEYFITTECRLED